MDNGGEGGGVMDDGHEQSEHHRASNLAKSTRKSSRRAVSCGAAESSQVMVKLWLAALPAVTALMGGRRDIVVITHGSVGAASEVRALAQCATAALHLRHGMRESARVWLTL